MRKILLLSVLSFIIITTNGQSTTNSGANQNSYSGLGGGVKKKVKKERVKSDSVSNESIIDEESNFTMPKGTPRTYIGVGTGLDAYTGLIGFSVNQRLQNRLFVQAAIGEGSWGIKTSLGIRYDLHYLSGLSFGLGMSYSTGVPNMKNNLELSNGTEKEVTFDANPASTTNIKVSYNWVFFKRNILYLDFGYSIAMQKNPWTIKDGSSLSDNSNTILNSVAPGGLTIGVGFTFGINKKK